jgi:hypothetical protein
MGRFIVALAFAGLVAGLAPARAQTMTGATPAEPPAAEAAKAKRAKTARPAQSIIVANASGNTATKVTITGDDDRTATLSKPLAPKAKTTLKLPKLKGCMVSVAAIFEGEGQVDVGEFDICKDKTIRFTD